MGMILFILGVVLVVGGVGAGLPFVFREQTGLGLGLLVPGAVLGLGAAIAGLMIGKSKEAAPPPPPPLPMPMPMAPPPPSGPQGIQCPSCQRRLPIGVNRCPFCHPPEAPKPPPPPAPTPAPTPAPVDAKDPTRGRGAVVGPNGYMQILEGPSAGKQITIKPNIQITIGRADDNFLMIPDAEVSGRHCAINCANDKVDFTDLGSSNGSFLNDQPFRQGRINSGDTLRLGRTTKIFFSFK